jgi:GABA(A) receptor-associated protein
MAQFKKKFDFNSRSTESKRIIVKYPERIPIIVERNPNSNNVPEIDKQKFLVPNDLNVGQFLYIIRKRLQLKPEQAIFAFVKNSLPSTSSSVSEIYDKDKDEDGFLYFIYSGENTFGI